MTTFLVQAVVRILLFSFLVVFLYVLFDSDILVAVLILLALYEKPFYRRLCESRFMLISDICRIQIHLPLVNNFWQNLVTMDAETITCNNCSVYFGN